MDIAKRLKEARELKGATQTQVSKDTGINNKTLSGYERKISEPDLETLNTLANYYGVTTDYLLCRTDDPNGEEEIVTIAAHHDGEEFTEEEKKMIEDFKDMVRKMKQKKGQ
ncbi:HTH-type transcriptional regulator ImmR [Andreesenia angusta]|uniref:HTH-type transcriptional regulator ImmR n=1 Tax=Andreesenia angusta TaxID=39480 RepID=A0A1S1V703_9FIRM|nr:helix-turn-helix transcriptional regulator [Andreesenia angusta]OHW62200.1 HTH-type transcriptional regulator ImmR [Andreesenia angusta]